MQNEKQENPPLDDDILQSKADIREAIKAIGGLVPGEAFAEQSSQTDASVPIIKSVEEEDRFLEAELLEADLTSDNRFPQKKKVIPALPSNLESKIPPQDIRNLEKELREKTLALDEQTKRIAFIEKQLQNAVVLERAKSQLQQNLLHLNDQNQQLAVENRKLAADNQQLAAEIAQLRERRQDLEETDGRILQLRNKLENAELTLSHERTLTEELKHTIGSLEEKLATAALDSRNLSEKLAAKEQYLAQQEKKYEQLQDAYEPASNETILKSIDNQTEDGDMIPVFNLADQIMQEHRRSVASRRQRRETSSGSSQGNSVKHVVQQYVHSAGPAAPAADKKPGDGLHPWIDRSLTPFQQEILLEIVRNDVNFYTHKRHTTGGYSSMNN